MNQVYYTKVELMRAKDPLDICAESRVYTKGIGGSAGLMPNASRRNIGMFNGES